MKGVVVVELCMCICICGLEVFWVMNVLFWLLVSCNKMSGFW